MNPRFPHTLIVRRAKTDDYGRPMTDETGDELFEVVLESVCGLRDMVRGLDIDADVVKADYKLALPKHSCVIRKGDLVRFTHSHTGEVKEGRVEESKVFNLGANIWFNENGNG